jgi:hypothetical protein
LTLQRTHQPLRGISFFRRRSSCSSTGKASFSKGSGSSLAFARGLCAEATAAVRVDLRSTAWLQCALAADSWLDLLRVTANVGAEKPYGFWLLFISQSAAPQRPDGYVSKRLTQQRPPDLSTSSSRCALSRGLGYIYSTPWVATRFQSNSGHILHSRGPFNSRGSTRLKARGLQATCPSIFYPDFAG